LKEILEFFTKKNIFFKSFREVDKALLKTRKKLIIYVSTDNKSNYHSIFIVEQKSRFLLRNAIELVSIEANLQNLEKHNFKYKHLLVSAQKCSKASSYLKEKGWKIDSM